MHSRRHRWVAMATLGGLSHIMTLAFDTSVWDLVTVPPNQFSEKIVNTIIKTQNYLDLPLTKNINTSVEVFILVSLSC